MKLNKLAPKYAVQLARVCHRLASASIPGFKGSPADVDTTDFKAVVVDKIEREDIDYKTEFYSHDRNGIKLCECVINFNKEIWSFHFAEESLAHLVSLGKENISENHILQWAQTPIKNPWLKRLTGLNTNISKPVLKTPLTLQGK